jgi:predicted cobalt transporter CbtA
MVGILLMRGMLVGLVAGLLAFAFASVFGEPQIERAIAFEEATAPPEPAGEAAGHAHDLVSRDIQSTLGLLTGVAVYGTAVGGLFALVFAYAAGRVGRIGPRGLAALLALAGFVAIVLVPGLKYPANPPAVGDPETITQRTQLFFAMLAISIAATIGAVVILRRLLARHGAWTASLAAAAAFAVVIAVTHVLLPEINEVPDTFPATVLWQFRMAVLGMQAVLWTTLGLLFGWLTERSLRNRFPFARPAIS